MLRFAANLSLLFTEYPLRERFDQAAKAGFEGAELLFPYELAPSELSQCLQDAELDLALINMPVPDWQEGGRGCAAIPGQQDTFRALFAQALDYAETCNAGHIHILSGLAEGAKAAKTYRENLRWASSQTDHSLTIEPINPIDMPSYFLQDFDQTVEILENINSPNLNLQFDAYHAHKITGDVMGAWDRYRRHAVHIQIAGGYDRHEPLDGAIDYVQFIEQLKNDYNGYISAEYYPRKHTKDGLVWLRSQLKIS